MRNKKGFTLVELVIVIAVIAILAGVMIGTFASVVKKAQKSAEQQEMAAAKQEQTATDILEKLNNQNWLGWEDFEEKLAKALADINITADGGMTEASVKAAVSAALNEYAAAHPSTGTTNTGLTEQQVKYIIENALSGQLTEAQVKAVVNNAVSSTSTLTKSQVQAIVDAAVGKTITASQVKEAVDAVVKANKVGTSTLTIEDVEETVSKVLDTKNYSVLTEKEVEKIVKEALKDYSVEAKSVATVDELKEAFAENKGVTNVVVKLTDDVDLTSETGTLEIKNNTILDLGNKTITTKYHGAITISKGVTVTIKGDGEIVSEDGGEPNRIINNSGNLVIEGGTFRAGTAKTVHAGAIKNEGFMTINGGNFSLNDQALYNVYVGADSTLVINGGVFEGCLSTNANFSKYANVVINDGKFTSDLVPLYAPTGTWNIYGGTFTGKATAACICGGNVNLYGGSFISLGKVEKDDKTTYANDDHGELYADATKVSWSGSSWRSTNATILINAYRGASTQKTDGTYEGYGEATVFISKAVKITPYGDSAEIVVYDSMNKESDKEYISDSSKWAAHRVTVETATAE